MEVPRHGGVRSKLPAWVYHAAPGLLAVGFVLILALPSVPGGIRSTAEIPRAGPVQVTPAVSSTQTYSAQLVAVANASASSVTGSSAATWTGNSTVASSANLTLGGGYFTWNGTVALGNHGEVAFRAGKAAGFAGFVCETGTVTANLTVGTSTYSWSHTFNVFSNSNCWVYVAPSFSVDFPAASPLHLQLTVTTGISTGWVALPAFLNLTAGTGVNVVNATAATSGTVKPVWGWSWSSDPFQSFFFSNVVGATISWSSPSLVNAKYNGVTQSGATSGSYTDVVGVSQIFFQGTASDPANLYTFTLSFTVSNIVLPPVYATYNYTLTATHVKTSSQLAVTYTLPYNLTWSLYEFTVQTPFAGIGYLLLKGATGWLEESVWPSTATYNAANNSVFWATTVPQAIQVTFLGPSPYGSGVLTINYLPSSPLLSFYGSTIPFNSVATYVDGQFQPSATFPVAIGSTYLVATKDAFGDVLVVTNVTITQEDQVALLRIPIWPLSVADLNSTYVIGLSLTSHGTTQVAPDLAPFQTQVLFVPAGHYTLTLDYLAFSSGAVGKVVSVPLKIVGVGFYVVTGTTLTDIQIAEQNATSLLETVNVTFLSQTGKLLNQSESLSFNVSSIAEALPFRLQPGEPTADGNFYTVPIFLLNDTGALANASDVQQAWQNLNVEFVTPTSSVPMNWTFLSQGPGQFAIRLTLAPAQVQQIANGTDVVALTAPLKIGSLVNVASGEIGAETIDAIPPPGGWWNDLGINTPPPADALGSIGGFFADAGWLLGSSAGRAIYVASAFATFLYLWEERKVRLRKHRAQADAAERRKLAGASS